MEFRARGVLVLVAVTSVSGCLETQRPDGRWQVFTIDGVPTAQTPADHFSLADMSSEGLEIREGEMWTTTETDSLSLEFFPDGDFLEVKVEKTDRYLTAEAVRRMGQWFPGDAPMHEEGLWERKEHIGRWTVRRDSIFLETSREQFAGEIAGVIQQAAPHIPEDSVRRIVEAQVGTVELPIRYRGEASRDRLDLVDLNGRKVVFRRTQDVQG